MTILRIAWRNLWRNGRRTALALAAIGLSVTLVLIYDGILRGYGDWMVATVTGPMLGHAQIHAPEWRTTRAMDRTLSAVSSRIDRLRRDPTIVGATARVYAPALAALGVDGFAVIVMGIDVAAESGPNRLFVRATAPLQARHVLLGAQLAEQMGVRPGAEIAIIGQGADGSLANDLFTVTALVETSVDLVNRQAVIMDLDEAQILFAMPDEAHEIIVYARDAEQAGALAARLGREAALAGTEVMDWRSLAPQLVDLIALVQVAWVFVLLLVFVAAAAGVANTMLMATFERTHEFGMLLALGASPGRLVAMIGLESVWLGLAGAVLGSGLGVTIVAVAHRYGVDYAALTGGGPTQLSFAGMNWSLRLYPALAVVDVLRVVAAVIVTSVLASAWPAARAARLHPVRALRD